MKKVVFSFLFAVMLISVASAEITFDQQPEKIYNLGDRINIPLTITTSEGIYDFMEIFLICNSTQKEVAEENIALPANEAMNVQKSVLLIKKFIGLKRLKVRLECLLLARECIKNVKVDGHRRKVKQR